MSSKNLWADLSQVELVRAPRTILLEQAEYLTQATKGTLAGFVGDSTAGQTFRYSLGVKVPGLNNYQVSVLSIEHTIDLYPVRIVASRTKTNATCSDDAEFERAIGSVLSSPEIKTLLSRLLSQLK